MARGKPKINDLRRHTSRGRPTRTGRNPYSATKGASGLHAISYNPRLAAASLHTITPTPAGPEPGRGGKMF